MGQGLNPNTITSLVIVGVASAVAWSLWRGATFVRLYVLVLLILGGLIVATVSQLLGIAGVAEGASLFVIGFSFAGWASNPDLWRTELRRDLDRTVLYARFRPRDLRSWEAWLKLVDRIGARYAALVYLAVVTMGITIAAATVPAAATGADRTPMVLALAPVVFFALLSAWHLYRGARRLVPGA